MSKSKLYKLQTTIEKILNENPHLEIAVPNAEHLLANTKNYFENERFQSSAELFLAETFRNPENLYYTCKLLFGLELAPFQQLTQEILFKKPMTMLIGSRGFSKTFNLGLFSVMWALLNQGSRIVICAAGLRQASLVFEYSEKLWNSSPILQDMCFNYGGSKQGISRMVDRLEMRIGRSVITAIPIGTGEKIRGLRANVTVADEFASINEEIYENVIGGFSIVQQNPIESMKYEARMQKLRDAGIDVSNLPSNNQVNKKILSGTAYYSFNHFYKYFLKYKKIVESKGDINVLREVHNGQDPLPGFDWRDYAVIRVPSQLLPRGYFDEKQVAYAKATLPAHQYGMEYGARFATDSNGFFKRTLIESCCVHSKYQLNNRQVEFTAKKYGEKQLTYVMGIDPAFSQDNFAITILECHHDHNRIVYCWTLTKSRHQMKLSKNITNETDFYKYCSDKIYQLCQDFNITYIGIDSQGGGRTILERLAGSEYKPCILPIIEEGKHKDTDDREGRHIILPIEFSNAKWCADANHGLRNAFEAKTLLFPSFDNILLAATIEEDKLLEQGYEENDKFSLYDTMENNMMEIEELKDELATIVHSETANGREHWDTPQIKLEGNKKGRMRKDRYSALLIANYMTRYTNVPAPFHIQVADKIGIGGFAPSKNPNEISGDLFAICPDWFKNAYK